MLLRKKLCKTTAIAIAAISLFGTQINTVNAYQGVDQNTEISQEISKSALQNGEYKLKNIIQKDESVLKMYRAFFAEETKLVVKGGKYYLTFTNTKAASVPEMQVKIGETQLNTTLENIDENTYKFSVELNDLNSTISMVAMMPGHPLNYDISLDMDSLEVVKLEETQQPEVQPEQLQQPENSETEEKEEVETSKPQDTQYKDGLYTLTNEVTDHKMPQMIRSIFGENTSVELKNGKTYAVLTFTGVNMMNNHRIYVNGSKVSHQVVAKTDDSVTVRFLIPSIRCSYEF